MGYIKEPKGIDFIIKSEPLSDKEREAISIYIRNYKAKHSHKRIKSPRKTKSVRSKTKTLHS